MVRIAFLGDIMLGRSVSDAILTNGPYYPWGDTIQILREADLRIANLECPISHQGTKFRPKKFHFRASPRSIDALKAAGINCVALANNHVLDFGEVAMADTIRLLDEAGIAHAGAGCNKTQAMKPAFLKAGNLDIGVVSITDEMPNWKAAEKKGGINYIPLRTLPGLFRYVKPRSFFSTPMEYVAFGLKWQEIVRAIREVLSLVNGSDITVLSCHWGPNFRTEPYSIFWKFAKKAIECGADVIHGHSSHLFQGVVSWKNKPILFDTGDFLEDFQHQFRTDLSFIFMMDLNTQTKRAERITLFPVHISNCQTNIAPDHLAQQICTKMERLCTKMGTQTLRDGKNLVINLIA